MHRRQRFLPASRPTAAISIAVRRLWKKRCQKETRTPKCCQNRADEEGQIRVVSSTSSPSTGAYDSGTKDCDAKQLEQATRQADAAERTVWVAAFALAISIIGTVLLLATLYVTRDQERRSLRAYVSFDPGALSNFSSTSNPIMNFTIDNDGETPAFALRIESSGGISNPRPDGIYDRPEGHVFQMTYENGVPPKRPTHSYVPWPQFNPADYDAVMQGREVLVYYGSMLFTDIFGCIHPVQFCFYYGQAAIGRGAGTFCTNHNSNEG